MFILRVSLILAAGTICVADLPNYIPRCSRTDPELNECALASTRKALPRLVKARVNFTYDFDFNIAKKDNEEYMEPLKPTVTFKSGGGYVDFGDFISADSALGLYSDDVDLLLDDDYYVLRYVIGQQVNQFLNDNWQEAENELGSGIAPAIAEIISSIARQYFSKFSMTDMFLP
ncbi:hypothetical protein MML48_7g00006991 [Holotrichia oblita]|uniref:Uncharacterized protein n=1 Tax=Holotrichia oblita TaxID=644536 RepID=A0ACB9SQC9_HOLOL|nr:hypothetical protein MML48_7g00006991 [Holotrichia oblita]